METRTDKMIIDLDNSLRDLKKDDRQQMVFGWQEFQDFFRLHEVLMDFVVEPYCEQNGLKHYFQNVGGKNIIVFEKE